MAFQLESQVAVFLKKSLYSNKYVFNINFKSSFLLLYVNFLPQYLLICSKISNFTSKSLKEIMT